MKKKKMIKFRLIILMVLCVGLLLGAWIVRGHLIHEPFRTNVRQAFQAPCREYIFGTDNLGRCVACRILYGAATSLYAAVLAVLAVFIIGTAVGVTAAYAGDDTVMCALHSGADVEMLLNRINKVVNQ